MTELFTSSQWQQALQRHLWAEGIGSDVNMIMGNGYTKGHAEFTLQELRESPKLRKIFEELYA